MSERGEALKAAIGKALEEAWVNEFDRVMVARAICENLGLTWETHVMLRELIPSGHQSGECFTGHDPQGAAIEFLERHASAIATLLEAGGIER